MSAVIAGGITRAYSKAVQIGDPRTIATGEKSGDMFASAKLGA